MKTITKLCCFLFLFTGSYNVFACWSGCIQDECTDLPLAGYPITYCTPIANGGIGGCTTYTTDSEGCFSIAGEAGATISIHGTSYTYNGGPCRELGRVTAYGLSNWLYSSGKALYKGDWADVSVYNHRLYGCEENMIEFGYMADDIINGTLNYCMKIEVYQRVGFKTVLIETIDWGTYLDHRIWPQNRLENLNRILDMYPQGTYSITVSIRCCDDESEFEPQGNVNIFNGSFVWNPVGSANDVDFQWKGSAGTEAINNDGMPLDNIHPIF